MKGRKERNLDGDVIGAVGNGEWVGAVGNGEWVGAVGNGDMGIGVGIEVAIDVIVMWSPSYAA